MKIQSIVILFIALIVSCQTAPTKLWDSHDIEIATMANNTELIKEALESGWVDANAKVFEDTQDMTWLHYVLFKHNTTGVSLDVRSKGVD